MEESLNEHSKELKKERKESLDKVPTVGTTTKHKKKTVIFKFLSSRIM